MNIFVKLGKKRWKENMNLGPARAANKNSVEKGISDKAKNDPPKKPRKEDHMAQSGPKKKKKTWRVVGRNILESDYYEIAVVLLTFVALFIEDVEILLLTSELWDSPNTGIAQYIEDVVRCSCWVFTFVVVHRLIY